MFEPSAAPAPADEAEVRNGIVELMPTLRAFARSLAANAAQADDLVQESILKALANLGQFRAGTNLRAWMFTIMRNTFYSQLRKRRREVEDVDGKYAARCASVPRQDSAMDFDDFKRAVAALQADHREVLTLIGVAGCSYEEAAQICMCAVGTIKSRVNRARRRLADLMGYEMETAGDDAPARAPAVALTDG